jgi:prepilin-type N-terminal cleavage/methylation domain-containing protein
VDRAVPGAGFSLVELLFVLAILATLAGIGIPLTTSALDEMRVGMAARYVAGRIVGARLDALQRSTALGLRFEADGVDYSFATCVDGNGNGLRTAEIASGTDQQITPAEFLGQRFADVRFGLSAGVPDLDSGWQTEDGDGVRIGSSRILTVGPDGTATSGTLYVRGKRGQYAVRVLGATARVRLFQYQTGARAWIAR